MLRDQQANLPSAEKNRSDTEHSRDLTANSAFYSWSGKEEFIVQETKKQRRVLNGKYSRNQGF